MRDYEVKAYLEIKGFTELKALLDKHHMLSEELRDNAESIYRKNLEINMELKKLGVYENDK